MAFSFDSDAFNYLIKFDWNAQKAFLFRLAAFDDEPNSALLAGNAHESSIIYATANDAGNSPVRGFIVGSLKKIHAFNDKCDSSIHGYDINSYQQQFSSSSGKRYGFVDRIETDLRSCKHEDLAEIEVSLKTGFGRNEQRNYRDSASSAAFSETITRPLHSPMSLASGSGSIVGDWENDYSSDFSTCAKSSATTQSKIFSTTPSMNKVGTF